MHLVIEVTPLRIRRDTSHLGFWRTRHPYTAPLQRIKTYQKVKRRQIMKWFLAYTAPLCAAPLCVPGTLMRAPLSPLCVPGTLMAYALAYLALLCGTLMCGTLMYKTRPRHDRHIAPESILDVKRNLFKRIQ